MTLVQAVMERGSRVHTDAWSGYDELQRHRYKIRVTFLQSQAKAQLMPQLHKCLGYCLGSSRFCLTAGQAVEASSFSASRSRLSAIDPGPFESLVKYARAS